MLFRSEKIASASSEQSAAIEQITSGISQISSVVQTNAATAGESSAASEELSGQVAILHDEVSKFNLSRMNVSVKHKNDEMQ